MNKDIINMIEQGLSINQISENLKISPKQLYIKLNMLKYKGYLFKNNYYSNGERVLAFYNPLFDKEKVDVLLTEKNKCLNFLIISDTHFGSKVDDISLINKAYDFCIKEGVNIILHAGDFVEGPNDLNRFNTFDEQVDFAIKNYPFDKNILNFLCLGNHDVHSNLDTKQDLKTVIQLRRGDIIPLGYGIGKIDVKRERIILLHDLEKYGNVLGFEDKKLNIYGHSHKFKVTNKTSGINIRVPSLSKIPTGTCLPSFLKLSILFDNGYYGTINIEQYIILDKTIKIGEVNYSFDNNKLRNDNIIPNEYDIKDFIGRSYVKTYKKSSIDKFNEKWNRQS